MGNKRYEQAVILRNKQVTDFISKARKTHAIRTFVVVFCELFRNRLTTAVKENILLVSKHMGRKAYVFTMVTLTFGSIEGYNG